MTVVPCVVTYEMLVLIVEMAWYRRGTKLILMTVVPCVVIYDMSVLI